jgi:NADPH:quinone reductase-like Zn-dependent oxidoreductase
MLTMKAIVTTGTGGYEKLEFRDVPVPEPGPGEVLIQVLAAGMNNTEINTRLGWYSASVAGATNEIATGDTDADRPDGGWNEATPFPFIQGTDCCGRIVAGGSGDLGSRRGERVLVRSCMRPQGFDSPENIWMGSDFDGAFAQYVKVPASEAFAVGCDWSDAELGSIPCAYGTAESLIHRSRVGAGDHVVVTGASGGVGSAAVQLAKRKGAEVTAICGSSKAVKVKEIGADRVIERGADPVAEIGSQTVDVLIDIVGGKGFPAVFDLLRPGGRYATSGAVAGPIVSLDLRTLYLRDITMYGATGWDEPVFPNLVSYIERGEIRPLLAKTFALEEIVPAQKEFLRREHVGKFVLIPPG